MTIDRVWFEQGVCCFQSCMTRQLIECGLNKVFVDCSLVCRRGQEGRPSSRRRRYRHHFNHHHRLLRRQEEVSW